MNLAYNIDCMEAIYEDTGLEPGEVLTGKELAEIACAMKRLEEGTK